MQLAQQLANQFREVILDGRWIANTNFKDQIDDLTWEQATAKIGNLNTIADLTFHINYYVGGLIQVFEGGELEIRDKYSFDYPPLTSAEDWNALRQKMYQDAARFIALVDQMDTTQMDAVFVKEAYGNYYRNIIAMIEHAYYHLGQVVLLKKMILATDKEA